MQQHIRRRFWIETVVAAAAAAAMLLTVAWRDWIEIVFGIDPDHHSGALEWTIVFASALCAIVFAVIARHELRTRPAHT